jgi:Spy/CpxP family protein refolding chaperone
MPVHVVLPFEMKTNRNRIAVWGAAFACFAIAGFTAVKAQEDHEGGCHRPGPALFSALMKLGVTDSQKEQIHQILKEEQPAVKPLVANFVTAHRALRELVFASPVNEQAIRNQVTQVAAAGAELAVKHAHVAERIRTVLTPEQIESLKTMAVNFDAHLDQIIEHIANAIGG